MSIESKSKKKYEITIDLRPYTIELEKVGTTYVVKMGNKVHKVLIKDINPEERYALVEVNGEVHHVRVDLDLDSGQPIQIFLDGEPHEVTFKEKEELESLKTYTEISPLIKSQRVVKQKGAIVAPFNGTVTEIKVRIGDQIKAGDTVIIIEAMKMKNEIVSDISGVVKSIKVKIGDSVKKDQTLLIVDEK